MLAPLAVRLLSDVAGVIARHVLDLRKDLPGGDAQLGPGLQHPAAGLAQGQVLLVGAADQRVEPRVVEYRPPLAQVVGVGSHALVVGVDPLLRHRRGGLTVVGPDLESVVDVLLERSASAECDCEDCQTSKLKPRRMATRRANDANRLRGRPPDGRGNLPQVHVLHATSYVETE